MVWYKQGATPIVYAYMYRTLCYRYLNTNTTPGSSRCTIHLAEEWTGGVDVGWDSLGLTGTQAGVDCVVGELRLGDRFPSPGTRYSVVRIGPDPLSLYAILPAMLHTL
eukprot:3831806-Rhodomonas_salina.1